MDKKEEERQEALSKARAERELAEQVCSRMLPYAHVCSRMLTARAEHDLAEQVSCRIRSRILTYPHVCSRMLRNYEHALTFADVC